MELDEVCAEDAYDSFAEAYDALTFNVPYDEIAEYYLKIIREKAGGKRVLDMGCGTGSLTVRLAERGLDMIGQDVSSEMLTYAAAKSDKVRWICQRMEETELGERVDAIISTLDSVNHLPDRAAVERCFRRVYEDLKSGGVFAFDVNTVRKHRETLGNNTFVYDVDGVYCVWLNTFEPADNGVAIDLDLFFEEDDGSYSRGGVSFREIAFTEEELREMLTAAGFGAVNVYEYLTFDKPNENSDKLMIVAKREGNRAK